MSVQVAVRVRPFNERQIFINSNCCIQMVGNKTRLLQQEQHSRELSKREFAFDYSFWSHDEFQKLENGLLVPMTKKYWDQEKVFSQVGNKVLDDAWQGYNCCLFAYGQTGSGKSYSMLGYGMNKGIVPRVCEQMFRRMCANEESNKLYNVTISMIEIYNQKVQDLLIPSSKRTLGGLQIRQNKKVGVYVQGVTRHNVNSYKAIERWMQEGSKNRSLASTLMNEYSSRAHTIISIQFVQREEIGKNQVTQKSSTIHLIDLAGSERVSKTGLIDSDRLKEAGNINKSLHHLGLVIEILADKSAGKRKNQVVPYRSSCLTRILQNSLGGNSKTIMVCALSPAFDNYEETLSTLRYADQVKKIKNNATVNESMTDKLIRELRQENQRLRVMIKQLNDRTTISPQDESILKDAKHHQIELIKMITQNQHAMKSFAQGIEEENLLGDDISELDLEKLDENSESNQYSILDCFKSNQPFITNLNEDQMLNGKVRYNIESQLLIGRKNGVPIPQVVLGALGIQVNHAKIYKKQGKLYINSFSEASGDFTFLNGDNVYQAAQLYHNDRIILGTSCVFLVKIPNNTQPRPGSYNDPQTNYQTAISELQSIEKNKSMSNDQELINKLRAIQEEAELQKVKMQDKFKAQKAKHEEEIQKMNMQKQKEQELLYKTLEEKNQFESTRMLKQRQEMEQQKRRSEQLEELLEREKRINKQLEQTVQHSSQIEQELRENLISQQTQLEIQRLNKQKELVEQNLRRNHAQQKTQQERLRLESQKMQEQLRQKAEGQAQYNQEILRQNLIMCQNQNILNERFLDLKKKKKKVQDLRILLVKKERVELQKRLVELVPMLTQLNLIAHQMQRDIEASVKIQYQFFGYHQLTECLKTSSYKSKLKLRVLIDNHEEGRSYMWSVEQFKNRLDLSKDMLEKYVQDPKNPVLFDKEKDPFWDPCESQLIGEAILGMQHLLFQLDYYNPSLKIIGDQKQQGEMAVRIYPTSKLGSDNLAHAQQRQYQIFQTRTLLEKDIHFVLIIDHLVVPDQFFDIRVEYQLLEQNYRKVKYDTQKAPSAKQIHYMKKHTFKEITEDTLLYMGDSHICFKVLGMRRVRQIARSKPLQDSPYKEQSASASNASPLRPASHIVQNLTVTQLLDQEYEQYEKQNSKPKKDSNKKIAEPKEKKSSGKKDKNKDCLLF